MNDIGKLSMGHRETDTPRVSAIIVYYNEEAYLPKAIESVLSQTYRNWELLLVDDGSVDKSWSIGRESESRCPNRVRYLAHPSHANRGISASRNLGIANARGDYIAFLDADDVWVPEKLQLQVAILERRPEVAMVFGRIRFFSDDPELAIPVGVAPLRVPAGTILWPPTVFKQTFLGEGGMLTTFGNPLVRKKVLIDIGCFEEEFLGLGDDAVSWAKITAHHPVYAIDDCLLLYRRHAKASGIRDWRRGELTAGWTRVVRWLYGYIHAQADSVREWALPIVQEAFFRSVVREAWERPTTESRWQRLVARRYQLVQLGIGLVRDYPEIATGRRCLWLMRQFTRRTLRF